MPAIAPHDTAVIDEPWDAQAQIDKLPDPLTGAVGKAMYAWYDPSAPDTDGDDSYPDARSGWKFPHHEVDGQGKPGAANIPGCQNGLDRLENSGIPEADKAGVRKHLQHHLDAQQPAAVSAGAPEAIAEVVAETVLEETPERVREFVLSKPWAIIPGALIEFTARLARTPQPKAADLSAGPSRSRPTMVSTDSGNQIAVVPLRGMITPRGSFLSLLFGGSSGLQGFREDFREAVADDNVAAIVLDIDSPGGLIDLVPETAEEIRSARGSKPIVAIANTLAASAAYWIAAQADEIVVTPSGQVGSVGVFTVHEDFSQMEQMMGIKTTIISAGEYKVDGNPYEPLSKSAVQALQQQVDDLYAMFAADVAAGRGTSVQAVSAGFGQGRAVLAERALQLKMVDRVETFEETVARLDGLAEDPPEDPVNAPDDDEDDELAPQAGAMTVPERAQDQPDGTTPADYLNGEALREQPAWCL